jgi:predicted nucleic acid-binding protein
LDVFLDANIVISIYNLHLQAVSWFQANTQLNLIIKSLTWMEVLRRGKRKNKTDQQRLSRYLGRYSIVDLIGADQRWAMQQSEMYWFSHGVGILDCLIAGPCHRLQLPLYSRNLKHMTPILGPLTVQPY